MPCGIYFCFCFLVEIFVFAALALCHGKDAEACPSQEAAPRILSAVWLPKDVSAVCFPQGQGLCLPCGFLYPQNPLHLVAWRTDN